MKGFKQFRGVFEEKNKMFTINQVQGKKVYEEKLVKGNNVEYRQWDPMRSKLCSYLIKGGVQFPFNDGNVVLYLGASTGTTVSHVSDVVGKNGIVFAVDLAPRVLRNLVFVAEERNNIAPILANAGDVMSFADKVCQADIVYQDVAQKAQVDIFLRNFELFLKQNGFGYLAIKARSIDVTQKPNIIFDMVKRKLKEQKNLELVDTRNLDPFQKDHMMFVVKKK